MVLLFVTKLCIYRKYWNDVLTLLIEMPCLVNCSVPCKSVNLVLDDVWENMKTQIRI